MPDDHARITEFFLQLLELAPEGRGPFLDRVCRDQPELRRELQSLLDAPVPPILMPGGLTRTLESDRQPERIGPYEVVRKLGEGSMGVVYLARQSEPIRRTLALKVLKRGIDTDEVIARFDSEQQALALMDHPNIARVYDAGVTELGRPYFAMEYVDGDSLTRYCDRHRLSVRQRLELFVQVCEGAHHAHQKGIIHRDLKPTNVLVSDQHGRPVPKIIDFGVAKAIQGGLIRRPVDTAIGVFMGTPEYMSPEQAAMNGQDRDIRTDVYSLGVILYELLVGVLPFDPSQVSGVGLADIRRIIREVEAPRLSRRVGERGWEPRWAALRGVDPEGLRRRLTGDLDWLIKRALEKDRARRYASAADLAADIRRHLADEPIVAGPPGTAYRLRKFVRRNRAAVASGGLVLVAVALGFVGTLFGLVRATRAEALASEEAAGSRQVADLLLEFWESAPAGRYGRPELSALLHDSFRKIDERLGGRPELQATLMSRLSKATHGLRIQEAWPLLERGRRQAEALVGPDHPATLVITSNMALVLQDNDEYERAEALYVDTLRRQRRRPGPDHPDTLTTMHNLAFLYRVVGRFSEAEALFRETVEHRRRALGLDDPHTQLSMGLLGSVYLELRRFDDAGRVLEEALQAMGPNPHAEKGNVLYNLACVRESRGDREGAFQALERAVELGTGGSILEDPLLDSLDDDPRVRRLLRHSGLPSENGRQAWGIALRQVAAGRYDDAEGYFEGALTSMRRWLGRDHWETLACQFHLAELHLRRGDAERAEPLLIDMLDALESVIGYQHLKANVCWGLAQCDLQRGRLGAALTRLDESIQIAERALLRKEASFYRASLHAARGETAEALRNLRDAVRGGLRDTYRVDIDLAFRSLRDNQEYQAVRASMDPRPWATPL